MIRVEGVSFSYSGIPALSGVDLDVRAGDWLGVLGPNGSGKSTLLKLLYGALRPQSGTILFRGRPLSAFPARELAREMAVVPQDTSVHFPFLVEEVVLMGRFPHAAGRFFDAEGDLAHVRDVMRRTGVEALAGRRITAVSGGERQRVVIARALAQAPAVLLLDEPTAFLDIRHQVEISELLRDLNRDRGLTLVTAFHDINLAARCCARLVFLQEGRVAAAGAPRELVNEETLHRVYGIKVRVERIDGIPFVIPQPASARAPAQAGEAGRAKERP